MLAPTRRSLPGSGRARGSPARAGRPARRPRSAPRRRRRGGGARRPRPLSARRASAGRRRDRPLPGACTAPRGARVAPRRTICRRFDGRVLGRGANLASCDPMPMATTETLEIAFEDSGPAGGPAVILLHGWPDDAQGWREVSPTLNAAGFRTVTPYLRGCGGTRFRERGAVRDGRAVALAQDAVDLADALHIETFAVAGHDWGARAAYTLA